MEAIKYLGKRIYRWQVGASTFLACPEKGARLMNWNLSYADGTFRDIIHWPTLATFDQFVKARGGNPILFPFSARSFHDGEIHLWKDPTGHVRPMPMHGLARQGDFEITRLDKKGFAARFLPRAADHDAYPYEYDFEVIYRFEEKEFSVELRLKNHDDKFVPWSAGHHFYFTIPWLDGTDRRDYKIRIPAKKAVRQNSDGSLSPIKRFKKSIILGNPTLIDRIHYGLTDSIVECVCSKDESRLEIEIGTNMHPNQEYAVVTWTENDDSPFFCIEPWMGPPNSVENELGLHKVGPSDIGIFSATVRV